MFELRWATEPDTTTKPPVLQWRHRFAIDEADAIYLVSFGEWTDVPFAVVPDKPIAGVAPGLQF